MPEGLVNPLEVPAGLPSSETPAATPAGATTPEQPTYTLGGKQMTPTEAEAYIANAQRAIASATQRNQELAQRERELQPYIELSRQIEANPDLQRELETFIAQKFGGPTAGATPPPATPALAGKTPNEIEALRAELTSLKQTYHQDKVNAEAAQEWAAFRFAHPEVVASPDLELAVRGALSVVRGPNLEAAYKYVQSLRGQQVVQSAQQVIAGQRAAAAAAATEGGGVAGTQPGVDFSKLSMDQLETLAKQKHGWT